MSRFYIVHVGCRISSYYSRVLLKENEIMLLDWPFSENAEKPSLMLKQTIVDILKWNQQIFYYLWNNIINQTQYLLFR